MEIDIIFRKKKITYSYILDFIENSEESESKFQILYQTLEKEKLLQKKEDILSILQLLCKIANNHHRASDFINKYEKLFQYIFQNVQQTFSASEIMKVYFENKRILLLLLEKKFIQPERSELIEIMNKKSLTKFEYSHYLYGGMKEYIEEEERKQIEREITQKYNETIESFEEKCRNGENDSYICSLIRKDSVEEFISHVNRSNISLTSKINQSIYETNLFLIGKCPTLIEYASFFGSIQIILYLKFNKVQMRINMWYYAVHSNNADLIHLLEENDIKPVEKNNININVFKESIKCHHNDVADYIENNYITQEQRKKLKETNYELYILSNQNYHYYPDICQIISNPRNNNGFNVSNLCSSLKMISIPSSVTTIGNFAFFECSSLTQILIPSSIKSIGEYSFSKCSSLTQILIPSSVESIGDFAFSECSSLEQISIPSSVNFFGKNLFDGIEKLKIKGDIKSIPSDMFYKHKTLKEIEIPSSIKSIKINEFYGCTLLTKVSFEIPCSITKIDKKAFYECFSLSEINIPSISSIQDDVFYECKKLTKITIPSSATSIGEYSFCRCISLEQVTFEMPSSLTSIEYSAFQGCSSLTRIVIPSSVTAIKGYAFNECSSLIEITIPSSVTLIGLCAFSKCSSLKSVSFEAPSSLQSIGDYAFSYCYSLKNISISSSIASIGKDIFKECSLLKENQT
ncbi:hypothetical protein M9Y10_035425 [Tritrichomonas musculus]|uniref:Uncharacterized protein n=1 Tax=Tritrichomonas musculus TaxID=1915356 RepID=A0ABR2KJN4_9EUKA